MFNSSTLSVDSLLPSQLESAALQLIQESMADPWGDVSPAIYDTARVLLLPSLQPKGSLDFILCNQNDDGSWGGPGNYCLVPSLAATASLLHLTLLAARGEEIAGDASRVAVCARRGLDFVAQALGDTRELPDTVAIELLVPAVVEEIAHTLCGLADVNAHHTVHAADGLWQSVGGCLEVKVPPPDMRRLARLRAAARSGEPLPIQLCHTLEVLGSDIDYVNDVQDVNGVIGGSPAATIAMLNRSRGLVLGEGEADKDSLKISDFNCLDTLPLFHLRENGSASSQLRSIAFLSEIAARLEGALPNVTIDTFERSWVIYNLIQAGVQLPAYLTRDAVAYFTDCLGPRGACGGNGLPPDSDTSSVLLYILSNLGYPVAPTCLLLYESDTFFQCFYAKERTPSVGANAHILEAFGSFIARCPLSALKYRAAMAKISAYLLCVQQENGSWLDKWHASPYYGTACSVLALWRFGIGNTKPAIERALAWVLRTQREDGSWGVWCGTLEETAYALQMLLLAGRDEDAAAIALAASRGARFLVKHLDAPPSDLVRTPLWHDKELYEPVRIVRAVILSALYLYTIRLNTRLVQKDYLSCAA